MAKKIRDESELSKAYLTAEQQKEMEANLNAYKNLNVYANSLQTAGVVGVPSTAQNKTSALESFLNALTTKRPSDSLNQKINSIPTTTKETITSDGNTTSAIETFLNALNTKKPTDALNEKINSLSSGEKTTYPMNANPYQEGYAPSDFETSISNFLDKMNTNIPFESVNQKVNETLSPKVEANASENEETPSVNYTPNYPLNAPIAEKGQNKNGLTLDKWEETAEPEKLSTDDSASSIEKVTRPAEVKESASTESETTDEASSEAEKPTVEEIANASYEDILNKYLNRESFSYNPQTDAMYQNYLATMNALGQRSMKDAMGQAAALSGGYGSSYAQNVGTQAYNQYLEQANEALPTYYSQAYNKYQNEGDEMLNKLSVLGGNSSADEGKSNITATQYANILKGVDEADISGGEEAVEAYMATLVKYGITQDEMNQIMDYLDLQRANRAKQAEEAASTPVSYTKSKIIGFKKINASNDEVEIKYGDGHTETKKIKDLEGVLTEDQIKQLKDLGKGSSINF